MADQPPLSLSLYEVWSYLESHIDDVRELGEILRRLTPILLSDPELWIAAITNAWKMHRVEISKVLRQHAEDVAARDSQARCDHSALQLIPLIRTGGGQ